MERIRALQLLAMHSVVKEPEEYSLRFIFRWYSREFATPLHVVETLPLDDILEAYYECDYEKLEEHERKQEVERLLITPDKLARLRRQEDAEDADAAEFGKEAAEAAGPVTPSKPDTDPVITDPIMERFIKARAAAKAHAPTGAEVTLPTPTPVIEEGISMRFEDLADTELEDGAGFGPPEKKP